MANALTNLNKGEILTIAPAAFAAFRLYKQHEQATALAVAIPAALNFIKALGDTSEFSGPSDETLFNNQDKSYNIKNLGVMECLQLGVYGYGMYVLYQHQDWVALGALGVSTVMTLIYGLRTTESIDIL